MRSLRRYFPPLKVETSGVKTSTLLHSLAVFPLKMSVLTSEERILHTFALDNRSSDCGYPLCCPGRQPRYVQPQFYPSAITNLGIEKALRIFFKDIKQVFHRTGMPMLPFFCHHFCLPFSPFCASALCSNMRWGDIRRLVKKWNQDVGKERGVYLQFEDPGNEGKEIVQFITDID